MFTDIEQEILLNRGENAILFKFGRSPLPLSYDVRDYPKILEKGSAFSTVKVDGELRGCIGNLSFEYSLYDLVGKMSYQAAFYDKRFEPVKEDELDLFTVDLSILKLPEPVFDTDDISLGEDGLILSLGKKRSLFLPEVMKERGWKIDETIRNLEIKGSFPRDCLSIKGAKLEKFRTFKISRKNFMR